MAADGGEPAWETAVSSDLSEDDIADVSFGKSLLAELTTSLAELSTFLTWDSSALHAAARHVHVAEVLDRGLEVADVRAVGRLAAAASGQGQRHADDGERGEGTREHNHHAADAMGHIRPAHHPDRMISAPITCGR